MAGELLPKSCRDNMTPFRVLSHCPGSWQRNERKQREREGERQREAESSLKATPRTSTRLFLSHSVDQREIQGQPIFEGKEGTGELGQSYIAKGRGNSRNGELSPLS